MTQDKILNRRKAQAKWYHENKHNEDYKAYRRAKQKQHAQKHVFARLIKQLKKRDKTATVTRFDLWCIARRQRLICPLTGQKLTAANISPDHISPLSKGGATVKANIRLITQWANMARGALTDSEFIKQCQSVVNNNTLTGRQSNQGIC